MAAPTDQALGGGAFIEAGPPSINARGHIAFVARVTWPGRSGIFLLNGESVTQLVATGDPAPSGGTFFSFYALSLRRGIVFWH